MAGTVYRSSADGGGGGGEQPKAGGVGDEWERFARCGSTIPASRAERRVSPVVRDADRSTEIGRRRTFKKKKT